MATTSRFRRSCPWAQGPILGLLLVTACTEDVPVPAFRHADLFAQLAEDESGWAFRDGVWLEDYGDAAFYGLAYHSRVASVTGDPVHAERAAAAYTAARAVVERADLLAGDVNEISMSALGMIEHMAATGDASDQPILERFLDELNEIVEVLGYYLGGGIVQGYAVDTYGPTAISGLVALINLQAAFYLGGEEAPRRITFARQASAIIDERAWSGTSYDFGDERPGLFLYPNVTLILLHARLYQLTGEETYRQRALDVHAGIQPLKVGPELAGAGRYRSPYSAEHMGATTDDYSTLSSQNYTLFALLLLYEITGRARFLEEWNTIVDFAQNQLYSTYCRSSVHLASCLPACVGEEACVDSHCLPETCQPGLLHHWMDGRIAQPEHPEVFCSGCNLQLLYILWYRQHLLPPRD